MKRRRFLKTLLAFLGTITLSTFFYSLLKYLTSLPTSSKASRALTVRKSDIPVNESRNFVVNDTPIVVINRAEKGLIALSRVCTHLGCLVEFSRSRQQLICPCHAGVYDLDGGTVSGPPPKPLAPIPLRIEGESIILG